MKRRIRRIRRALKRAGLYNVFHITLIAVLLTGFCVILFNVKEPEQQEKEPEEIQAEVMQNPETMTQTAENIEDKYKVFDTMSEDWGSDDLEGFVFYDLPEQYADKGYFPEKMQIYTRCLCKQYDVPYALVLAIILLKSEDNQVTRLREALEEVSDAYDYCVCDCGRLLDMVVINILIAAELIIAPVKVGGYEIEALQNLEEQIEDLRDINPDLRIKALMTMRQKNKTSLEVEEWLKAESGFDMFVTPIRRSIIAEKSTTAMIPLPKFSKRGIVSQDYRCVVHELLTEMEG